MRKSNNLLRDEKRLAKCCEEEENKSDDRKKIQIKFVSLCANDDISSLFRVNEHDVSTSQRAR